VRPEVEAAILAAVSGIEPGDVMTYGEVAEVAGMPGRARAVGRILAETSVDVPWWRVVGAGDRIVSPDPVDQTRRLRAEGHHIVAGRIRSAQPPH
jgi:methylated-DNA-protein-cysteine methyltransferase related protein